MAKRIGFQMREWFTNRSNCVLADCIACFVITLVSIDATCDVKFNPKRFSSRRRFIVYKRDEYRKSFVNTKSCSLRLCWE